MGAHDKYKKLAIFGLKKDGLSGFLEQEKTMKRKENYTLKLLRICALVLNITIDEVEVTPAITILDSDVEKNSGLFKNSRERHNKTTL